MSDSIEFFVENNISASDIRSNVTPHRNAHMVAPHKQHTRRGTPRATGPKSQRDPTPAAVAVAARGVLEARATARAHTPSLAPALTAGPHTRLTQPGRRTSDGGSAAATSDDRSAVTSNGGSAAAAAANYDDGSRACTASTACERSTRRSHASDARREAAGRAQWVCMANGGRGASSSAENAPGSAGSAGSRSEGTCPPAGSHK